MNQREEWRTVDYSSCAFVKRPPEGGHEQNTFKCNHTQDYWEKYVFKKDVLLRNDICVSLKKNLPNIKTHYVLTSWNNEIPWLCLWSSSCRFLKCSCLADWRHMVMSSVQASILLLPFKIWCFFVFFLLMSYGEVALAREDDDAGPVIQSGMS